MADDPNRTQSQPPDDGEFSFDAALDAGLAAAFEVDSTQGRWTLPPQLDGDSADPIELAPSDLCRYALLGEIARGGMGIVLKGRDPEIGRDLAVKVLRTDLVGHTSAEQRFVEEAQVGGQLQHPGVVPVYELGRFTDGRPYFTMKLIKGHTLADMLANRADLAHDRVRFLTIFEKMAETIAYVHSKGVIHRDLKPSNVMVGAFGEVQVVDWGLAKLLRNAAREARADEPVLPHSALRIPHTDDTRVGSIFGTPAFMSPEQAAGETDKIDERADVFGLGAILCVILTGEPPFVAATAEATRLMAVRGELTAAFARLDACGVDAELIALCKHCLAADVAARPRNGTEVSAAIVAFRMGVEERARTAELERAAAVARVAEERKRHHIQRALAASVLLTMALVGVAGVWFASDRARRATELDRAVKDAEGLLPATQTGPPAQRLATVRAALTAARTADGQFGFGLNDTELRAKVSQMLTSLQQQEKTQQLLLDLEEAWLRQSDLDVQEGAFDPAQAAPLYAAAFRKAGLDPLRDDPIAASEAIRQHGALASDLSGALYDWSDVVTNAAEQKRLRTIAEMVAPGSPRVQLAALLNRNDPKALDTFLRTSFTRTLSPTVAVNLARQLRSAHDTTRAVRLLRTSHEQNPNDFWVNFNLGCICVSRAWTGPPDEAIRYFTAALAVRPDNPVVYTQLGYALAAKGRSTEAVAAFNRAIALNSNCYYARAGLSVYTAAEARAQHITALEKIAAERPDNVEVQTHLATMYYQLRRFDKAVEQFQRVIDLQPYNGVAYYNLGISHLALKREDEAEAAFRESLKLRAGEAARNQLMNLLHRKGSHAEEWAIFKAWYDELPETDPRRKGAESRRQLVERLATLEKRLPEIRASQAKLETPEQSLEVARLCMRKKLYADGLRFFKETFAAKPALADDLTMHDRYNAACAAARAAQLAPDADRPALRRQALDWLRADLQTRTVRATTTETRAAFQTFLRDTMRPDPDFASVRSAVSLVLLPEAERTEWQRFWADVDAALQTKTGPEVAPRPRLVR